MCAPLKILEDYFASKKMNHGILSIWGDFGVGKTTLSLQILLYNMLQNYNSIFIYTKPNFPFRKLYHIFERDLEKIPSKILLINSTDFNDLYHVMFNLEFFILQNKKDNDKPIKLILIDSLTDLYRLELDHEKKDKNFVLNYKLNTILGNLTYFNKEYEINIVVVNEVSKKSVEGQTIEIEAGGNVMDYWIKNSLKIERLHKLNERKLVLFNKIKNIKNEITLNLTSKGFKD